jgi:hypothetical protein
MPLSAKLAGSLLVVALGAACIHEQHHYYGGPYPPPPSGPPPTAPTPAPAPPPGPVVDQVGPVARYSFLMGWRAYDDSWDPFDDQFAFFFGGAHEWPGAPFGVEWGVGWAWGTHDINGFEFENSSFDLSVGATRTFHLAAGRWFTNIGAGIAWNYAWEGESDYYYCCGSYGTDDDWFAGYVHGGIFYRIAPTWDIALDLRYMRGEDPELSGVELDGEYLQLMAGFGFGF